MLRLINLFFLIFSFLLHYKAPEDYSFNFCLTVNIAFIIQNVLYFVLSKRSLVSFEFFFMFAFYCVNFVYPVFYFPSNPTFGVFEYAFNYQIICKSTAVAFVAYTCYMFGLSFVKSISEEESKIDFTFFSKYIFKIILYLFLFLTVWYIISVGVAFFKDYEWYVDENNYSPIVSFINILASMLAMFVFFIHNAKKRAQNLIIILFFVGIYLLSGSRNMPLGVLIILLIAFNDKVREIPKILFLGAIILGIFIFAYISYTRLGGIVNSLGAESGMDINTGGSVFDFASDLVCNNRNLYVLVDYADTKGLTYGLNMLSSVLGLVPFLGKFVSDTFGIPMDFMYTAGFNTFLEFGFGSTWGLGGNIVADVYLSFGFFGVIAAFLFLGFFVSKVIRHYKKDIFYYIIYCVLASNSIFMNRESFLLPLRGIIYSLILVWVLNKLFKNEDVNEYSSI